VKTVADWKAALRAALLEAMRARQSEVVAALRETLAAIDNAEAADPSAAPAVQSGPGPIAGGVAGLGAGEVPRRVLTATEAQAIVEREIAARREAASTYADLGREQEAGVLRRQAEALARLLAPTGR
jgi:uncharacterized protein YqeY